MRKIIVSIHSSFNGVVGGPPSDETNFMVWAQTGIQDTSEKLLKSLSTVDTILLGHGTHDDLSRKWPFAKDWPDVDQVTLRIAEKVNSTPKLVAVGESEIAGLSWGDFAPPKQLTGSRAEVEKKIEALKAGKGGDIITFGSPTLVQSLTNAGLVDEYHVIVHPVLVNEGRRLFDNLSGRTDFRLISADTFEHGVVFVKYETVKA